MKSNKKLINKNNKQKVNNNNSNINKVLNIKWNKIK
jgi:hypothetical protein